MIPPLPIFFALPCERPSPLLILPWSVHSVRALAEHVRKTDEYEGGRLWRLYGELRAYLQEVSECIAASWLKEINEGARAAAHRDAERVEELLRAADEAAKARAKK